MNDAWPEAETAEATASNDQFLDQDAAGAVPAGDAGQPDAQPDNDTAPEADSAAEPQQQEAADEQPEAAETNENEPSEANEPSEMNEENEPSETNATDAEPAADAPAAPASEKTGDEPDDDRQTFADLGLGDKILKALKELGYERPSPIQAETIPALLDGRDVVGLAQTGTGKTAAFALPILSRIDLKQKAPQALVLAPTRELALQVAEAFESYSTHLKGVKLLPVYGGQGYGIQLSALARGVHIIVGTPGRIMDHLDRGTLDLTQLRYLVLDEADEMLSMGFSEDIEKILADTPDDKQVALFSATMPKTIRGLSKQYLNDPLEVKVQGKTETAANVTHRYLISSYPQKVDALTRILEVENFDGMIVFVRTKNETETLAEKLRARGYSAQAINGDLAQASRERTINQLKDGKLDILIATDVAARGLDVDRLSHVVNFDIPTDTESYVHRTGRTGRAGRSGNAISFITPRERYLLRHIEKATGQALTQMSLPSVDDINSTRLSRFDEAITTALSEPEKIDFFRDVVAHYVNEFDVPEVDVAAALAAVMQGDEPMLLEPEPEPRYDKRRRDDDDRGRRGDRRGERGDRGGHDRDDRRGRFDRDDRGGERSTYSNRPEREWEDRGDRGGRGSRGRTDLVPYRIAVGRRQKIGPRQIVGALANEGGLQRDEFGKIDIRLDYSIVELPAHLPKETWDALAKTRVSGQLIHLEQDRPRGGVKKERGKKFRD